MQFVIDDNNGDIEMIIVLKYRRETRIFKITHDNLGHLGHDKVVTMVRKNFSWSRLVSELKKITVTLVLPVNDRTTQDLGK